MNAPGHNMVSKGRVRAFIERIERLEEEKKAIADDIKEVFAAAKGYGYDIKVLKQIIKLRKIEPHDLVEHYALLDTYLDALGMDATPLGAWAAKQVATPQDGGNTITLTGSDGVPVTATFEQVGEALDRLKQSDRQAKIDKAQAAIDARAKGGDA